MDLASRESKAYFTWATKLGDLVCCSPSVEEEGELTVPADESTEAISWTIRRIQTRPLDSCSRVARSREGSTATPPKICGHLETSCSHTYRHFCRPIFNCKKNIMPYELE